MDTEMNTESFEQQFTDTKDHTSKYIHNNKIRRHRNNRKRFYCTYDQLHICPVDDNDKIEYTDFFENHIPGIKSQNDREHTLKRTYTDFQKNHISRKKSQNDRSMSSLLLRRKYCKHLRGKIPRHPNSNQRKYQLLDQKKRQSVKLRKHQSIRQQREKHSPPTTWPNYDSNTIFENMATSNPFEEASHIEDLLEKIFEYQQRIIKQRKRICSLETQLSIITSKKISYKTLIVRDICILIFFVWMLYL